MIPQLKQIFHLGLPLCLTFVIQMFVIIVDSIFAGNISYQNIAAVSIASSAYYIFLLLLVGITIGSSVKAGQAYGADKPDEMVNVFRQGAFMTLVLGIIFTLFLLNITPLLLILGQSFDAVELSKPYLYWYAWTLPIQGIIILARSYYAVVDKPWISVSPMLFALFLNGFLDYVLSTGELGFPDMGISGIGLASLISNIFLITLMLRPMGWNLVKQLSNFLHPMVWRDNGLIKLFILSLPISMTMLIEEAFFSGSTFVAGSLGSEELAAHQILFNSVGTSFLFNTGIAMACSILIGKYIGANKLNKIWPTVKAGCALTLAFSIPFAIILIFLGDQWIGLFLDDSLRENQVTVLFVKNVLPIAIIMLLFDSIWLVILESLHGMLDTTFPAIFSLIAYWILSAPLAYWIIKFSDSPFVHMWWCMLLAICLLMVMLSARLYYSLRKIHHV